MAYEVVCDEGPARVDESLHHVFIQIHLLQTRKHLPSIESLFEHLQIVERRAFQHDGGFHAFLAVYVCPRQ